MRNSANNFADLIRGSIASCATAAMTGASSSVAFNEANDVLSLHLAEIGRLDATIDALQAEQLCAAALCRVAAVRSDSRACRLSGHSVGL